MPSNTAWNTLRNDLDSVAQNEKILKLFLQLAAHTANRLVELRKETDKGHDCNNRNDTLPISTTEVLVTQSPLQANLESLDENQNILNHTSSGDFEINSDQNQTAFYPQLQELFDPSNLQNTNDQDVYNLNSKTIDLIPKSVQDVQDTSSAVTGHNHKTIDFDTSERPILDSANDSLNVTESRRNAQDSLKSARNNVSDGLPNQIDLVKNITNSTAMNDLTKTVNKFFPKSQNLQESTSGISPRLFGTDLAPTVPKLIDNIHENVNQHISQTTQKPSDKIDDISQRFFDSIIKKSSGNILNPQTADNLLAANRILSSTKNIMESMIQTLPETAKGNASNLLNEIIPPSQDIINTSLKDDEEGQKQSANSGSQQEQSKGVKQAGEQFDNPLHNRQDLTNNLGGNTGQIANASERNNRSSIPLLRLLPDFNEQENNNNETELSSIHTNENASRSIDDDLISDYQKTDQLEQINEEINAEEFKKMNETRPDDNDDEGQLNPISEDLSQKSTENGLKEVTVTTSPNQLESSTFTLVSITDHEAKDSSGARDSKNVNDIVKSDLKEERRLEDNSSDNDKMNRSTENQIIHTDNDDLSDLNNRSLIDNSKGENEQLSEAKLQEISDRLINALWPIIEKRMNDNQTYVTDQYNKQWNKNLSSNILVI